MKRTISVLLALMISIIFISQVYAVGAGDRIDMSVSPIRDEFDIISGAATTRTIQYTNNSDGPYTIYVTVEDCAPSGNYGTPICKLATSSGVDSEFSSTWITVSETNFVVPARTSKTLTYTVIPPANAAPGGHYGAIFFNNPDTPVFGSNTVGMIRRIGMLYMMKMPGNIVVNPSLGDILVDGPGGAGGGIGSLDIFPDFNSAPELIDAIKKHWNSAPMWGEIADELNPFWEKPSPDDSSFTVSLQVPVKNDGNIHIRPTGKIYLFDENDVQLEKVGKESIVDENGVYRGEKIVNYLPINNENGSVLPNTERTFQIDWLGFGYEERDPVTGINTIIFETPGKYYTRINEEGAQYIYPWEKLSLRTVHRTIRAKIEFSYFDVTTGEDITSTMELPLNISYRYITKTLNYGMLFLVGFIIFFAWIFIRRRDKRIEVLEDENDELEDEISVLERAKDSIVTKKATRKKATPKTGVKKETQKENVEEKDTTPKKPTPKTPVKRKTPAKKDTQI